MNYNKLCRIGDSIDTPVESNDIHSNQPQSDPSQTQQETSQQPIIVINAQPQSNDINSNATNEAIVNNGNITAFTSETTSNPLEILQELDAFLDMDIKKSFIDYIGRMKNITLTTVNDSKISDGLDQGTATNLIHACVDVFYDTLNSYKVTREDNASRILRVLKNAHESAYDLLESFCNYTKQDIKTIAKDVVLAWEKEKSSSKSDTSLVEDSKISDDEDCEFKPGYIVSIVSSHYGRYKGKVIKVDPDAGVAGKLLVSPIGTGPEVTRWVSFWDVDDDIPGGASIDDCDGATHASDVPSTTGKVIYGKHPSGTKYPNIDKYLREHEAKKYDPMGDSSCSVQSNEALYKTVDSYADNGSLNNVINEGNLIAHDFGVDFDEDEKAFVGDDFNALDSLKDYLEEEYGIYGLTIDVDPTGICILKL